MTKDTEIAPALVERLVRLMRIIAAEPYYPANASFWQTEARAIVAELPAPIDPDLLLAREYARDWDEDGSAATTTSAMLYAIKRVRQQDRPQSDCPCKDASSWADKEREKDRVFFTGERWENRDA